MARLGYRDEASADLGPKLAEGCERGRSINLQDNDLATFNVRKSIDAGIAIQAHVVCNNLQVASDGLGHLVLEQGGWQRGQAAAESRLRSTSTETRSAHTASLQPAIQPPLGQEDVCTVMLYTLEFRRLHAIIRRVVPPNGYTLRIRTCYRGWPVNPYRRPRCMNLCQLSVVSLPCGQIETTLCTL